MPSVMRAEIGETNVDLQATEIKRRRGQGDQNRKGKRRKLKVRLGGLEREMISLQKQVVALGSLHATTIRITVLPLVRGVV